MDIFLPALFCTYLQRSVQFSVQMTVGIISQRRREEMAISAAPLASAREPCLSPAPGEQSAAGRAGRCFDPCVDRAGYADAALSLLKAVSS
jgi:hypothetical protein